MDGSEPEVAGSGGAVTGGVSTPGGSGTCCGAIERGLARRQTVESSLTKTMSQQS